jgi:hypothetical protein
VDYTAVSYDPFLVYSILSIFISALPMIICGRWNRQLVMKLEKLKFISRISALENVNSDRLLEGGQHFEHDEDLNLNLNLKRNAASCRKAALGPVLSAAALDDVTIPPPLSPSQDAPRNIPKKPLDPTPTRHADPLIAPSQARTLPTIPHLAQPTSTVPKATATATAKGNIDTGADVGALAQNKMTALDPAPVEASGSIAPVSTRAGRRRAIRFSDSSPETECENEQHRCRAQEQHDVEYEDENDCEHKYLSRISSDQLGDQGVRGTGSHHGSGNDDDSNDNEGNNNNRDGNSIGDEVDMNSSMEASSLTGTVDRQHYYFQRNQQQHEEEEEKEQKRQEEKEQINGIRPLARTNNLMPDPALVRFPVVVPEDLAARIRARAAARQQLSRIPEYEQNRPSEERLLAMMSTIQSSSSESSSESGSASASASAVA